MSRLNGKSILLGLTGSISVYKSCELIRLLKKEGADVSVVMTRNAGEFIGKPLLAALSGHPAVDDDFWRHPDGAISHISLVSNKDLFLIAPATGNILGKAANGIADDLLSDCILARRCPLMIAPAMNCYMWTNPATQRNVRRLKEDGVIFSGPSEGIQACGDSGAGRFREPKDILEDIVAFFTPKALAGRKVVVTAGPTFEALDPVRGLTNASSGKQGYAIADQAAKAGAEVWLISGPVAEKTPDGVHLVKVKSALDMLEAAENLVEQEAPDAFIGVAAVADWRPAEYSENKMKKGEEDTMTVNFVKNPDVIASIAATGKVPVCAGFAAETENITEYAARKLEKKGLDLVVANDAGVIGSDNNDAFFVTADGIEKLGAMTKTELAGRITQRISELLADR